MENYNYKTVIKIEEENEDTEEQYTNASVKKTKPNYIDESNNSYPTIHHSPKPLYGDAYNVSETCNETVVQVEVDIVNGYTFESVIEYQKNGPLDVRTKKYGLDELQQFVCEICSKVFTTKTKVAKHITRLHSTITQKKTANKVVKSNYVSFSRKQLVAQHKRRVHAGEKPFECFVCLKSFAVKSCLTKHQRVHTGEKPYKCDVCLKSFSVICNLIAHKRVHTGKKPYKCNVCSKSFSAKSGLTQHKRVHAGEKPYSCDVCSMTFSGKSSLTLHKRVHTGEKPYTCDVCLMTFFANSSLKQHERVHTGEKPFKCAVCFKSFSLKITLTEHQRVHTGEKPYSCDVCLKLFSYKSGLWKHVRVHTNG
ncbi:zinc finger protein 501-like [Adelges cooleyi]|uniref:zinc finger protein 501-like n=1 Tax=Adelges cooleyi TaxID=133065 RepID=UPI00217F540E|nr:zinc finger protein 501-like [Adelges cooleyi]